MTATAGADQSAGSANAPTAGTSGTKKKIRSAYAQAALRSPSAFALSSFSSSHTLRNNSGGDVPLSIAAALDSLSPTFTSNVAHKASAVASSSSTSSSSSSPSSDTVDPTNHDKTAAAAAIANALFFPPSPSALAAAFVPRAIPLSAALASPLYAPNTRLLLGTLIGSARTEEVGSARRRKREDEERDGSARGLADELALSRSSPHADRPMASASSSPPPPAEQSALEKSALERSALEKSSACTPSGRDIHLSIITERNDAIAAQSAAHLAAEQSTGRSALFAIPLRYSTAPSSDALSDYFFTLYTKKKENIF